jgi:predicted nucleotide-binding protein
LFLNKYDGSPIPKDNIAENVLIDMGVPKERSADVLSLIIESANGLGLIQEIKNKKYVNLSKPKTSVVAKLEDPIFDDSDNDDDSLDESDAPDTSQRDNEILDVVQRSDDERKNRRVFITHGKNKEFVEPIKKLLSFGELEAVVSVEKQSVSQPVPEKVMNDMRDCGAAIIHVEGEQTLVDKDAKEHVVLNPNVLIEIGAAMALYGKRFILLVKEGVKLPSNLQGLYEVRYEGKTLDGDATIKLLESINEMKKTNK